MTLKIADRLRQTTTTTGTGPVNLIAPATGDVSFVNGIGSGNSPYYIIDDGAGNWEVGKGTVTAGTPDTLSRDTVIINSLGTTALINFVAGTKTIICDVPASKRMWTDDTFAAGDQPVHDGAKFTNSLAESIVASAATTDLGAVASDKVAISGTTTITGFGTKANCRRYCRVTGTSFAITRDATALETPTGASIQAAAGDTFIAQSDASGHWRIVSYTPYGGVKDAFGTAVSCASSTPTNLASVSLTPGRWRVSGTIMLNSSNNITALRVGINTVSATMQGNFGKDTQDGSSGGNDFGGSSIPAYDITLSATTTVYLVGELFGTTSNCNGYIRAERTF